MKINTSAGSLFCIACILVIKVFFVICSPVSGHSQIIDSAFLASRPEFKSLAEASLNPEEVYKLNLRKKKLKSIPPVIFTFTNLRVLNLSKNKIKDIPDAISELVQLTELDLSDNKIEVLPSSIASLINLRKFVFNRNPIDSLPPGIGELKKLEILDLWGTQIVNFPSEISKLNSTLKVLDLRVIFMNQTQQDRILKLLPDVEVFLSRGCDCN